jgi:hypothetical protein
MNEITKIDDSVNKVESNLTNALLSAGYIGGIFLGIIGFVLVIIELSMFYKVHEINGWPKLKNAGTIRDSYLENTTDETTYSAFFASEAFSDLYYRNRTSFFYQINGKNYLSTKYSYYEPWENNPMPAKIENDKYKPGVKTDIIVNPKDLSEAYIVNKPYVTYTKLALGIVLSCIGLYVLYKN